uniref:Uncharacterized protein n=1 Tax=Quercus lobata TaxID=97700 RepID=A0A7N2MT75_QUELO
MEPFQSIIRDPTRNNDRYEQRQGQLRNNWAMARQRDKHGTTAVVSLNRCRGLVTRSVAVNHRLEFEMLIDDGRLWLNGLSRWLTMHGGFFMAYIEVFDTMLTIMEDELKKGEMEADTDRMMREYRAQLDAERARKLAQGKNHSSSKSSHKKDKKDKDLKKRSSSRKRKSAMTCFWHMHEFLHWKLDAYAVTGGCKIEIPHFPLLILSVGEEGSISFYIEGNCRICSRPGAVVAHSRRRSSESSSSSSSSDFSSSDEEDRESRRSKSRSKRTKKEKKHRSRSKHCSSDDDEADGPVPLSRFFESVKS